MGFRKEFMWGAATASYQIEGAVMEDGKGVSVWDTFAHTPDKIVLGHTGDVACDHYHRYKEDVALMKELGIKMYRFSLSWTRILPNGIGEVNQKGIDFYNALIDELISAGIEPCITLYHWDYPQVLEDQGGWLNEESPKWFEEYARIAFKHFADRVKYFITFNEPQCFLGLGQLKGIHAPGSKHSKEELVVMIHHVLKAHGLAVKAFREISPNGKIGYAPCSTPAVPDADSSEDIEAARKRMFDATKWLLVWGVTWYSDPVVFGRYPEESECFAVYGKYLPEGWRDDMPIISEPIDFYAQNIYQGTLFQAKEDGYEDVPHGINTARTAMGWPIVPESLYWGTRFLYERYRLPILISENGMACHDTVSLDGRVHDPNRIDYMHRYLRELQKAADDGVDVMGYLYWSLMDNFEWAEGYVPRFGLLYVDYETQERIRKDSFEWYAEVIRKNGDNL